MNEPQLANLVSQAASGDLDALQCLIVRHHAALRGVVIAATDGRLRHRIDPDDILQQAYITAFRTLNPGPESQRPANPSPKHERGITPRSEHRQQNDTPSDNETVSASPHTFASPAHFQNWLKCIALDRLKDAERAAKRKKRDAAREAASRPDPSASYPNLIDRVAGEQSTPSRRIAKDEAVAAVMTSLARLNDDQREVVRLRFLEDVPVADIARRLGKTDTAVYTLCHRGLKRLRELMGAMTKYLSRL